MQVVILCGGLGTRLREETEFRPKPMVEIGGRPILWHIMKTYAAFGHTEFVLVLGYKGDMIKDYFVNYEWRSCDVTLRLGHPETLRTHDTHQESGWTVTLAQTGEKALKGARLKKIQRYIDGDVFMTTYGDGVSNIDIDALLAFHKSHGRIVTITGVNPVARFGEMRLDGGKVVGFLEKPDHATEFINGGYFVFDRRIFDYLDADDSCDLERGTFERLAREGEMMLYRHNGFWGCMDTQRDADWLRDLWDRGEAPWRRW